jgi:hypothetical protein
MAWRLSSPSMECAGNDGALACGEVAFRGKAVPEQRFSISEKPKRSARNESGVDAAALHTGGRPGAGKLNGCTISIKTRLRHNLRS